MIFSIFLQKSAKGSVLLDKVFEHLELVERDYFGLQFDELLPPPEVIHPLSSPHLVSRKIGQKIPENCPKNS